MKTLYFWTIAWTLAFFTAIVFTLDVLLGLLFPNWWVMQKAWELILPGFTFISWGAFFLGLVESFVGGFLTAGCLFRSTISSPVVLCVIRPRPHLAWLQQVSITERPLCN